MAIDPALLPRDPDRLIEIIVALQDRNAHLEGIIAALKRTVYGPRSEKLVADTAQLPLDLDDLILSDPSAAANDDAAGPQPARPCSPRPKAARNIGALPKHLPRYEVVIEPESKACPCCGGALHVIGEDVSKRLDRVPAKLRVVVTRRPKYACRSCEKNGADNVAGVIQAPAPARLIVGGLPTEALVADVVVSKYADHLPLYRQAQILGRQGVKIDRSTLAQWVGTAAAELQPLHDHLVGLLKASPKLFCDETRCPVLDPGRGKTKTGYMWSLARDHRPWGGRDPPAVAYTSAPGRGGTHAVKLLAGFGGILQVDGYSVYKQLTQPTHEGGPVTLAYCWSHLRRKFYEVYVGGHAPIATE